MSWREAPRTEGQKLFVKVIYDTIRHNSCKPIEPFKGKTKGEACMYISKHKPTYDEIMNELREQAKLDGEYQALLHENAGDRV